MLLVAILFAVLLFTGVVRGELEWPYFLGFLGAAGMSLGAILLMDWPLMWYTAILALLDVVLVIWIFKGNLTIR